MNSMVLYTYLIDILKFLYILYRVRKSACTIYNRIPCIVLYLYFNFHSVFKYKTFNDWQYVYKKPILYIYKYDIIFCNLFNTFRFMAAIFILFVILFDISTSSTSVCYLKSMPLYKTLYALFYISYSKYFNSN